MAAVGAVAVVVMSAGCTPKPAMTAAAVNDRDYTVTPNQLTVNAGPLSGTFTEMKVVERVEAGSGRVDQPARLTGKLVLTNVSKDQSVHLLGAKLLYIDAQGRPIQLEDKRAEPTLKFSSSYGSRERLDPGQEASQPVEADFPAEALKAKRLKEIRLELLYTPSAYKQETMNFGVAIGGQ
jgi:hypothetical protein